MTLHFPVCQALGLAVQWLNHRSWASCSIVAGSVADSHDAWHLSWAGFSSSGPSVIDIPLALAQCLDIQDGISVSLLPLPQVIALTL